jgi:hypothetical protein
MKKDNKKQFREAKRQVKKDGNRERRRYLKKQLLDDPENAHLYDEDDYDYGFNSSTHYNGIDRDSTRRRQQEYEDYMYQQDNEEEERR